MSEEIQTILQQRDGVHGKFEDNAKFTRAFMEIATFSPNYARLTAVVEDDFELSSIIRINDSGRVRNKDRR